MTKQPKLKGEIRIIIYTQICIRNCLYYIIHILIYHRIYLPGFNNTKLWRVPRVGLQIKVSNYHLFYLALSLHHHVSQAH